METDEAKRITPTAEQLDRLLHNLMQSKQFSNKPARKPILALFFQNAHVGYVTREAIKALPEFKHRDKATKGNDESNFPGAEVSRIRDGLDEYFSVNRYTEPIRFAIGMGKNGRLS